MPEVRSVEISPDRRSVAWDDLTQECGLFLNERRGVLKSLEPDHPGKANY